MPTARFRRIFRLVVLVVAGPVLLATGYVGSVGVLCFVDGADAWLDPFTIDLACAYVAPLEWYMGDDLPGTEACETFWTSATRLVMDDRSLINNAIHTGSAISTRSGHSPGLRNQSSINISACRYSCTLMPHIG